MSLKSQRLIPPTTVDKISSDTESFLRGFSSHYDAIHALNLMQQVCGFPVKKYQDLSRMQQELMDWVVVRDTKITLRNAKARGQLLASRVRVRKYSVWLYGDRRNNTHNRKSDVKIAVVCHRGLPKSKPRMMSMGISLEGYFLNISLMEDSDKRLEGALLL